MTAPEFDAIIIGSGMSGGWVAKELTERGLKVVVLERGRDIDPARDFKDFANPWEIPNANRVPQDEAERDYPIQSTFGAFQEVTKHLWVKDSEHPYSQAEGKPFNWLRGYQVGGRSLVWGRQTYRFSDLDFDANRRDGIAVDWPIRYDDLASWYDHVERFAGIAGTREGIPHLPDGQFIKPMGLNCVEDDFAAKIAENFGGRRVIPGRNANLSEVSSEQAALGRAICQYRNFCVRGCSYGAAFSSVSATLPAARNTGRMTLVPNAIVAGIDIDPATRRATGVRVIDSETRAARTYTARIVFLNASAIASAQILLNSASEAFPRGLANTSDQVGRNLIDHIFGVNINAAVPGHLDKTVYGRRPNGFYIPRYQNLGDDGAETDFIRGFGFQGNISREGWEAAAMAPGIGGAWKDRIAQPGGWRLHMTGFGEMLPDPDNRVTIDRSNQDRWGINQVHIDCSHGENERKMARRIASDAREMCERLGYTVTSANVNPSPPGHGIHEMGTLRMGRDPATSVLNGWNQSHDIANLFCTDGGAMTASACQNPSLTYMALSARASAHAVELMQENVI